jgi:hypothetical protein
MGPIGWHGAETFGFVMTAGDQAGQGTWSVTLIQGAQRELLGERLELRVDPLAPLHVGCDEVGADEAADVPFHVNLTPGDAGSPYLLVGTTAGTLPPTPFPPSGIALPLAWSPYLRATVVRADSGPFVDTAGALDANGRARALLRVAPGQLERWGSPGATRFDWAVVVFGSPRRVFGPVGFDLR